MAAIATAKDKIYKAVPLSQIVADLRNSDRSIREDAAFELSSNGTPEKASEVCSLLADPDISVRNLAAEVLVKMGPIAANALLAEADSPDHDVRKFAVDIMALIGDPQFVPALINLLKDKNENVVCSAAEAFGRIKDTGAVKALIECRKNHPFSELQVIEALGNIGSNDALPVLYEVLNSDNVVLAYAAVEAVGKIGTHEALNKLLSLLNVKNLPLRSTVLGSVLKIANAGSRADLYKISDGKYVDYLIDAAASDDISVKSAVIKELAFWSGANVVSALIGALNDSDEEIVNMALGALRITGDSGLAQIFEKIQSGDDHIKKCLIEVSAFLKSSELFDIVMAQVGSLNPDIRCAVAKALSKYTTHHAIEALVRLADDEIGHVRAEALKSLGLVGDKTIVDRIYPRLDDEYPDVREACLGALVLINGKLTVNFFRQDIESSDINRRVMAVRALGWIGEPDAAEVLLTALRNDEAEVRRYAVLGLAKMGHPKFEENLTFLLTDENPEVRKAVVDAYLQITPQTAASNIKVLLDDNDVWVRFYAINALSSIGDMTSLDKLLEIASEQPPFIQIAIINLIAKTNNPRALKGLQKMAGSENEDIKRVALEAIEAQNA